MRMEFLWLALIVVFAVIEGATTALTTVWFIGGALAALAAWAATALDVEVLRKCFGAFLIAVGAMELFGKARE